MEQRVVTSPNSTGYAQWVSTEYKDSSPQYFTATMFNVTNPEEVEQGAKPKLKQIGPIVYRYHYHFFNISWSEDLLTVQNMKYESYDWLPELSAFDPYTTELTFLNVPMLAVKAGVDPDDEWWSSMAFDLIASAANQTLFTKTTIHNFIWGYESPFLQWVNQTVQPLNSTIFQLQPNDTSEGECFDRLHGQYDEYYTGKNDSNLLNWYTQWHGMRDLEVWGTEDANKVYGYDGTGYSILIPEGKNLTIFVDTLYRHLVLWHNMTEEVEGITLDRYWLADDNFFNITQGDSAYHLNAPHGMSNMSAPMNVMQGTPVPIFMSLPLFFHSDDSYFEAVDFLPPNNTRERHLHNTELMIEPTSGITMKVKKRVQVNVRMTSSLILYPNVTTTFMPIAWFELSSTISEPLADQVKSTLLLAKAIAYYCPYVLGGLSGLFLLLTIHAAYMAHIRSQSSGYDLIEDTEEAGPIIN
eukprot:TRINITY_DN5662_c0_g1_i1.p1 TRINITY_DN5662_c0_g1~~TRINITY_DN5662_c0_g1_i1.p1  ORF type:complete len:512 (-),score=98.33 TRINITY_DN5662_c0_g1_i1:77-1480(-)